MWWMGEKHVIDGRTVRIKGLGGVKNARALRAVVLEFCERRVIAKRFPVLTFEVTEYRAADARFASATAWIRPHDAMKGEHTIYLNKNREGDIANLPSVLEHEATHLWQATQQAEERFFDKLSRLPARSDNLRKVADKDLAQQAAADLRFVLAGSLNRFFAEGLATYAEKNRKGEVEFSIHQMERLHEDAARDTDAAFREWQHALVIMPLLLKRLDKAGIENNIKVVEQRFEQVAYDTGYAMVYALLMEGETTIEEMITWSDHAFVKRYERACHTLGLRPIVTLTIHAPFCYTAMIKQCINIPIA